MKSLVKGILAIGTAIAVGCVIYKKVKKVKEDKQNKEEVIIEEETQELEKEQQEIYNEVRAQVMKEMKPYMRRVKILRFIRFFIMFVIANSLSIIAITYDMERMDNIAKGVA